MNDNDAKWIDLCESLNKKFKIIVDNDEVYVVDTATDKEVYTFSEYGWRFALGLLRYIGCNAEDIGDLVVGHAERLRKEAEKARKDSK